MARRGFKTIELPVDRAGGRFSLGRRCRRSRRHRHGEARLLDHLLGAVGCGDRELTAEDQCCRRTAVPPDLDNGDAAANAGDSRRCPDLDITGLAQLAPDEAKHTDCGVDRQLAAPGCGIEHELIDGELGIGTDAERRAVEKKQLCLAAGVGRDALFEDDLVADHQGPLVAVGLRAGGGRIDRAGDADADQIGRCRRYPGHPGERKRSGHEKGGQGSVGLDGHGGL